MTPRSLQVLFEMAVAFRTFGCLLATNKIVRLNIAVLLLFMLLTVDGRICGRTLMTKLEKTCNDDLDCSGIQIVSDDAEG